ncbi:hypothetical protein [Cupriavidus neocaledonicus]|uniref:Uncharacterized protein n=1 Tax=Cupriavidus neocaledonicus TaxID=1040979 RepID=A0A375H1Z0_9BURK|nr:hypothetical protein [Cupriavidus neocaledonicus]SOZ37104.1 conserved hypothetical protein [Cupriavidus neocaledonicus]SPD45682.1 conserved protein of unknown function [Cupriavidus neocaledonicus]
MKHSKHDTSNDPALDRRQGLDDRELKENAADNQRARERARADWEHAASHRKDDQPARKQDKPGKGEMPPGVGARDLHDPGSRDPDAPPTVNRS